MTQIRDKSLFAAISRKNLPREGLEYTPLKDALDDFIRMNQEERLLLQFTRIWPPMLQDNVLIIEEKTEKLPEAAYGNLVIISYDKNAKLREYDSVEEYIKGEEFQRMLPRHITRKVIIDKFVYQNGVINLEDKIRPHAQLGGNLAYSPKKIN